MIKRILAAGVFIAIFLACETRNTALPQNYAEQAAGAPLERATSSLPLSSAPIDSVRQIIAQVNRERILTDMRRLTGKEPICIDGDCHTLTNRETGSEDLQWAKDYIYETLVNLHYPVEVLDWSREGYADQNILARKAGRMYPGEEIYLIAHLDGYLDNNPAANDDASGAASLLELARILSSQYLNRTVILFFSTGEEHGSLGSHSFVNDYPQRLSAIQYVVSVEMIGYDSNNDNVMELWNGDQPASFVQTLLELAGAYQLNLRPEIVSGCT